MSYDGDFKVWVLLGQGLNFGKDLLSNELVVAIEAVVDSAAVAGSHEGSVSDCGEGQILD